MVNVRVLVISGSTGSNEANPWTRYFPPSNPVPRAIDGYGFSLVSDDGKDHDHTAGYYTSEVTIPPVIPDGQFILG